MRDRIVIAGMQFFGRHGVYAHETKSGQLFTVDVDMRLDLEPAGQQDDLALTVDYSAVFREVRAVVEGGPRKLIEAVAEGIAARLLQRFPPLQQVTVRVHKQRAPIPGTFADVYVEVVRCRG